MEYWNSFKEDEPSTYVSSLDLEQAIDLFRYSLQAYLALCEIDTPFGEDTPAEEDDLLDARDVLLFAWRNAIYDFGYRKAPFRDENIGAEPENIKSYMSADLIENPVTFVEPGVFGHKKGDIMVTLEDLYSVGIRNGLNDLNSKEYAQAY